MLNPLLLLRVYNQIYTLSDYCINHVVYLWKTLVSAYTIKTHIFFEGIVSPYSKSEVNLGAPSSAVPLWHYSTDTKRFVEWSRDHRRMSDAEKVLTMKELPILSMAIVDDERIIHDLTDFVGSIRVFHSDPKVYPSIAHIVGAWSLSSGIVLNPLKEYFANSITSSADTIAIPISTTDYFNLEVEGETTPLEPTEEAAPVTQST